MVPGLKLAHTMHFAVANVIWEHGNFQNAYGDDVRILILTAEPQKYFPGRKAVWGERKGIKYRAVETMPHGTSISPDGQKSVCRYLNDTWKGETLLIVYDKDRAEAATALCNLMEDLCSFRETPRGASDIYCWAAYTNIAKELLGVGGYQEWVAGRIPRVGVVETICRVMGEIEARLRLPNVAECEVVSIEEFYQAHPRATVASYEITEFGVRVRYTEPAEPVKARATAKQTWVVAARAGHLWYFITGSRKKGCEYAHHIEAAKEMTEEEAREKAKNINNNPKAKLRWFALRKR